MALEDELSCPICTDLFREPVLLSCGHSFCRQCIGDHWTSSSSRKCPVCRQVSLQPPVSNLCLRNTCESYLREQRTTRTERSGEHECPTHGEKIELFCQTDEQVLCSECKKLHRGHKTQPLQQAVRQRKGKLKAAICPVEKTLLSLQSGTSRESKISRYIQSQTKSTERSIKMEFEKLQQFLRKEEQSRIAAVNEEEKEKVAKMERAVQNGILSLSERIREVEEGFDENDINFLKSYHQNMNRAKYTLPDQELSSETLLDVSKHLGNLKYQVWEKMKEICPYYPVILNPNTELCVSDNLTSVTSSVANALPLQRSRVVLGSVALCDGVHSWEIEVGKSRHWSLGVCLKSVERSHFHPLTPENGFWGLRRDGDSYHLMTTGMGCLNITGNPEVVRVKLDYYCDDIFEQKRWRMVSFFDASCDAVIAKFAGVPLENKLFPFVIPEDQSVPLRIVPANVILTIEKKLSFRERHELLLLVCFGFVVVILMILSWKTDHKRN